MKNLDGRATVNGEQVSKSYWGYTWEGGNQAMSRESGYQTLFCTKNLRGKRGVLNQNLKLPLQLYKVEALYLRN